MYSLGTQKPLVLHVVLLDEENKHTLSNPGQDDRDSVNLSIVFTSSVDSTHRLIRLLQLSWKAGGFRASSAITEFPRSVSTKNSVRQKRRMTTKTLFSSPSLLSFLSRPFLLPDSLVFDKLESTIEYRYAPKRIPSSAATPPSAEKIAADLSTSQLPMQPPIPPQGTHHLHRPKRVIDLLHFAPRTQNRIREV